MVLLHLQLQIPASTGTCSFTPYHSHPLPLGCGITAPAASTRAPSRSPKESNRPIQPIPDGRSQPRVRRQGERAAGGRGRARHRRQEPDRYEEDRRGRQGCAEAAAAPRHHGPLPRLGVPASAGRSADARGRGGAGGRRARAGCWRLGRGRGEAGEVLAQEGVQIARRRVPARRRRQLCTVILQTFFPSISPGYVADSIVHWLIRLGAGKLSHIGLEQLRRIR